MKLPFLQYLQKLINRQDEKENLYRRELMGEIGPIFFTWAEEFVCDGNVNRFITLDKAWEDYHNNPDTFKNITRFWFKSKLQKYCRLKGYVFNPVEQCTNDFSRIIRYNSAAGRSIEYLFIKLPQ